MDGQEEFFRGTADGLTLTGLMTGEPFEFTMSADGTTVREYGERQHGEYTVIDIIEAAKVSAPRSCRRFFRSANGRRIRYNWF